jgi:prevent-host-death family protein
MHIKTVGSFEAKTHLPSLLDHVALGEKIVITRRGIPVALLMPYKDASPPVDETIETLLKFRKKLHLKGLSIRDMKEEGRRF